jgi:hypothetical protein
MELKPVSKPVAQIFYFTPPPNQKPIGTALELGLD